MFSIVECVAQGYERLGSLQTKQTKYKFKFHEDAMLICFVVMKALRLKQTNFLARSRAILYAQGLRE